jgi:cation diffusion facilitator family transporter
MWNVAEGIIAIAAGLLADSVALVSFGIDSGIEVASAAVVLWRLMRELGRKESDSAERLERRAARITGGLLLILAAYITVEGIRRLLGYGAEAEPSPAGLVLTALSLVVMPLVGWAKLRTAGHLQSPSLRADAFETITCAWLSLTTLVGLAVNAAFGWSWADPLAALAIVPLVVREGLEGWKGEHCCGE